VSQVPGSDNSGSPLTVPRSSGGLTPRGQAPQNLADVLERVLDKGIVIVGDIQIRLLDIELLTIKVRLMIASVERAKEMGINWWEGDPFISTPPTTELEADQRTVDLQRRVEQLERQAAGGEPAVQPDAIEERRE
jgi:hypothetical protein